mmetsp:Transcript_45127/g.73188  ORF Transcript_45127/g.73188 Transcript_45127/m.73188 type:complete len:246 (+) Transcript_45127:215-952(+)
MNSGSPRLPDWCSSCCCSWEPGATATATSVTSGNSPWADDGRNNCYMSCRRLQSLAFFPSGPVHMEANVHDFPANSEMPSVPVRVQTNVLQMQTGHDMNIGKQLVPDHLTLQMSTQGRDLLRLEVEVQTQCRIPVPERRPQKSRALAGLMPPGCSMGEQVWPTYAKELKTLLHCQPVPKHCRLSSPAAVGEKPLSPGRQSCATVSLQRLRGSQSGQVARNLQPSAFLDPLVVGLLRSASPTSSHP